MPLMMIYENFEYVYEEAEVERFYEDLQDLLEHPKKMSFSL